ncbi:MAG TPA: glycosyltransferase, partial [Chitinophagaceae bacterium]|nr:glycosyltransferase [Chitinophagaceae bacterium]
SREVLRDFDEQVGLKGRSTVLYNFVDENFFAPEPKQEFSRGALRMVAVGNLREQKNYFYLLEAFQHLPQAVSLDIYGEGPLRPAMEEFIVRNNLAVRLCGLSDRLHLLLRDYDLFVMSSLYEGQPLALLEAMASGLPALLSDIPVLREVAGNDALYFDISDPQSFCARVKELMEGKGSLSQLARGLHRRAREFAHQHQYFERLNRLYDSECA